MAAPKSGPPGPARKSGTHARATQKSLPFRKNGGLGKTKRDQENGPKAEKDKTEISTGLGEEQERRYRKVGSNWHGHIRYLSYGGTQRKKEKKKEKKECTPASSLMAQKSRSTQAALQCTLRE